MEEIPGKTKTGFEQLSPISELFAITTFIGQMFALVNLVVCINTWNTIVQSVLCTLWPVYIVIVKDFLTW